MKPSDFFEFFHSSFQLRVMNNSLAVLNPADGYTGLFNDQPDGSYLFSTAQPDLRDDLYEDLRAAGYGVEKAEEGGIYFLVIKERE